MGGARSNERASLREVRSRAVAPSPADELARRVPRTQPRPSRRLCDCYSLTRRSFCAILRTEPTTQNGAPGVGLDERVEAPRVLCIGAAAPLHPALQIVGGRLPARNALSRAKVGRKGRTPLGGPGTTCLPTGVPPVASGELHGCSAPDRCRLSPWDKLEKPVARLGRGADGPSQLLQHAVRLASQHLPGAAGPAEPAVLARWQDPGDERQ